jgi:hypothetical protein
MDSSSDDAMLSAEEIEANSRAEERYFTSKKAGPRPTVKAQDKEELISFVEDGLNRGAKVEHSDSFIAFRICNHEIEILLHCNSSSCSPSQSRCWVPEDQS